MKNTNYAYNASATDFIKDIIEDVAELMCRKKNIIFGPRQIHNLSEDDIEALNDFHMYETFMTQRDDDYFCDIRADHFCIEYGESENYNDRTILLITANHKGYRTMIMLYVPKKQ